MTDKIKPEYRKFLLTELIALIQKKYKVEIVNFFFENKQEYKILKPQINLQVYTPQESILYHRIFVLDFFYFKITRFLY